MNDKAQKKEKAVIRMLKYILPHWYLIVISTVAGVIKLTLPLLIPQVMKYFTDDLLVSTLSNEQKIDEIYKWMLILLLLLVFVYIPMAYLRDAGAQEVSNRVMHKMRCQLYDHLLRMSAKFHQDNKSGALVTRFSSDIEQIHQFTFSVATNIWIDTIILVVYISLMLPISVPLTIVAGITLPLSVFTTKKIRQHIRKNSQSTQKEVAESSSYIQERMSGYAVVKLFNMEEVEKKKYNELSKMIYKFTKKRNHYGSMGAAVTVSFSEIISVIVIGLSARYIVNGQMTVGDMIVFYSYLGYLITPLRRFAELNVTYARSMAGIERVFEILDAPIDIVEKEDAIELKNDAPMNITFRNVSFKYLEESEQPNIDNLSFDIKDGEKIALVGSSGCGKTTLVNLLTRFYDIDAGSIEIDGHDIRDYTLKSLYSNMGMVFQDTSLFSGTIEENLRYGKIDATKEELEQATQNANAYHFIMSTPDKWDTVLGERGIGLSGGQKQRISIARVFLKNPRLLILDEATSALDSESEELVQSALDHLMQNRTSIIIAHRLSTIVNVDRIIVMDKGRIVEVGTHEELLKRNGRYTELYHMQFKDVLKEKS
ncbi:MAG: ABC transporter ATP-binding protein [Lachnospiraceae bacterium]|nr:ABC transporter ATP-binding protein [Lachnospiraceae bacterium]